MEKGRQRKAVAQLKGKQFEERSKPPHGLETVGAYRPQLRKKYCKGA